MSSENSKLISGVAIGLLLIGTAILFRTKPNNASVTNESNDGNDNVAGAPATPPEVQGGTYISVPAPEQSVENPSAAPASDAIESDQISMGPWLLNFARPGAHHFRSIGALLGLPETGSGSEEAGGITALTHRPRRIELAQLEQY